MAALTMWPNRRSRERREVAAAVEEGGGDGPAILWAAQWDGETPTLTDGGRFQSVSAGSALTIVTAASTGISGFPTTNVLRVSTDVDAGTRINLGNLAELAVDASRYHRIYMAHTMDDIDDSTVPNDTSAHPVENIHDGSAGGVSVDEEYGIGTFWRSSGFPDTVSLHPDWNPSFFFNDGVHYRYATSGSGNPMPIVLLARNTVYRFEWAIHRTTTTQYTAQARIYNAAGTLIADEDDFFAAGGTALTGVTHTFTDVASTCAFAVGNNQSNYFTAPASPHSYQAAPAISDDDWCGAYNADTETVWDA